MMKSAKEIMNQMVSHFNSKISMERFQDTLLCQADNKNLLESLPDNSISSAVFDPPYGIGFMGKEWDTFSDGIRYQQWCATWATELFRVLKPGAFALSFSSPRLYHRLVCGLEDSGFIVRDQLMWLYGSGFPKSRNVSNDIDRTLGKKGKVVGTMRCSAKGIVGAEQRKGKAAGCYGQAKEVAILEPCSEEATKWKGWGTALKPAYEPIVLVQKPLSESSIAKNLLKWGTGALNIDACRIGSFGGTQAGGIVKNDPARRVFGGGISNKVNVAQIDSGRFPSNFIIGEDVAASLGNKARFFYCPKASKHEKNDGCEHLEPHPINSDGNGRTFNDRCGVCGKKFVGSENTRCQCPVGVKKTDKTKFSKCNHHPTVKPFKLMEYLVQLVTPTNGICLDIFLGSGSTGIACVNLGFNFIGVEKEPPYYEIAKARIQHWHSKSFNQKAVA